MNSFIVIINDENSILNNDIISYLYINLTILLKYDDSFKYDVESESNKISMITAGDVLIHSSVYQDAYMYGNSLKCNPKN